MISDEERKKRNRECALRYYHANKKLKHEPVEKPKTLDEYIEKKRNYYKEYYLLRKQCKEIGGAI